MHNSKIHLAVATVVVIGVALGSAACSERVRERPAVHAGNGTTSSPAVPSPAPVIASPQPTTAPPQAGAKSKPPSHAPTVPKPPAAVQPAPPPVVAPAPPPPPPAATLWTYADVLADIQSHWPQAVPVTGVCVLVNSGTFGGSSPGLQSPPPPAFQRIPIGGNLGYRAALLPDASGGSVQWFACP